jgi:hypothetical protein
MYFYLFANHSTDPSSSIYLRQIARGKCCNNAPVSVTDSKVKTNSLQPLTTEALLT